MSHPRPEDRTPRRLQLSLRAVDETRPGPQLQALFEEYWPSYERWYLSEGDAQRPTYLRCREALGESMPELLPLWERFAELVGGGDLEARFLSLFRPPGYVLGCSQVAWTRDDTALVRNYDYSPRLFDGVILRSRWHRRTVVAVTDCLIGALDGINDAGLAVSLSFGGRRDVGPGFGAPLVVRYLLEMCDTTAEASDRLATLRTSMAYTLLVIDRAGDFVTAFLRPDRPTELRRSAVSTNHQDTVQWRRHASRTATVEREHFLLERLADPEETLPGLTETFLRPPLHSDGYRRGFGTLYTALYEPTRRTVTYLWPDATWRRSIDAFETGNRTIDLPQPGSRDGAESREDAP